MTTRHDIASALYRGLATTGYTGHGFTWTHASDEVTWTIRLHQNRNGHITIHLTGTLQTPTEKKNHTTTHNITTDATALPITQNTTLATLLTTPTTLTRQQLTDIEHIGAQIAQYTTTLLTHKALQAAYHEAKMRHFDIQKGAQQILNDAISIQQTLPPAPLTSPRRAAP